mgnify:CR=1 FL=1
MSWIPQGRAGVSAIELWRQNSKPPAVIFQVSGRMWQLGLVNAWHDLEQGEAALPPLPRFLVAHSRDRLETLLDERPESFVVLNMPQGAAKEFLSDFIATKNRFPAAAFAVVTCRECTLRHLLREYGVHCVVSSPRECGTLARWLAWHLRRVSRITTRVHSQIWDRLPWSQWDSRKIGKTR